MLGACAHHPLDCGVGFAWADCLPGTPGYTNGVGAEATARDDAQCRSYGLAYGTTPYADCRQKLETARSSPPSGGGPH